MAAPTDSARQGTNISTAATSHNINVGSPASGTLLIVLVRFAAAPGTITFTGYTQFAADTTDASDDEMRLYYRLADGTEGATDALSTTNSVKAAAICWEITGAENPATQAPQTSTVALFTTTINTANPATLSPTGGSKDYLFLAVAGYDGEVGTFTAAPTNYTNLTTANSGTGGVAATNCIIGGASRQLTAASDDPGVFTHGAATTGGAAWTVAIHPSSTVNITVTVPGAAAATGSAGLTAHSVEAGPTAASATASGPTPTVSSGTSITVTVPAAALANASAGSFTAGIILEPSPAAATASGPTPTVSVNELVSGVAAVATASGPTPTVTAGVNISPAAAAATGSGPTPTLQLTQQFSPAAAAATAAGPTPTVSGSANVTAVAATATAAASPSAVAVDETVVGVAATATAAGPTPTVNVSATVSPAAAAATGSGPTPTVTGGSGNTVNPAAAIASATGPTPTVQRSSSFSPAAAAATGSGPTPTVTAGVSINPAAASATATGRTPTLTINTTITAVSAQATGSGPTPTATTLKTVTVPGAATATATGPTPGMSLSTGVDVAISTATGPTPTLIVFNPSGPKPTIGHILHTHQGNARGLHQPAGRIEQIEEGTLV